MDQTLVIVILVGAIVVLLGLLVVLLAASLVLLLMQRRAMQRERERLARRPRRPARPPLMTPSPTPVSRVVGPPGFDEALDPLAADEAATEVMSQRHLMSFLDEDEETGTTEVQSLNPIEGELQLEETEETTAIGPVGRVVAEDS